MSQGERAEYLDCTAKLSKRGIGLRQAVEMLATDLYLLNQTVRVSKAVAAMLESQKRDGASRCHL